LSHISLVAAVFLKPPLTYAAEISALWHHGGQNTILSLAGARSLVWAPGVTADVYHVPPSLRETHCRGGGGEGEGGGLSIAVCLPFAV
jgi:hypothetical protein